MLASHVRWLSWHGRSDCRESFRHRAVRAGLGRTVGDYLAGMTDRFAQREFDRLFAAPPSMPRCPGR